MAKTPTNHGKSWTPSDEGGLFGLAEDPEIDHAAESEEPRRDRRGRARPLSAKFRGPEIDPPRRSPLRRVDTKDTKQYVMIVFS
jgi:hypothetical protein